MSAESMAEFYDAAEQIVSSSDDSEVCSLRVSMTNLLCRSSNFPLSENGPF